MSVFWDKLLITGTGRCGTRYIAAVAQKLGFKLEHERPGEHGMVAWQAGYQAGSFRRTLHQVRHPLDCIASLQTVSPGSKILARWQCSELWKYPLQSLCFPMAMWREWNLACEKFAWHTYRVESLTTELSFTGWYNMVLDGIDPGLGLPTTEADRSKIENISTSLNSRTHKPLTWEQLSAADAPLTELIKIQAKRYGYSID